MDSVSDRLRLQTLVSSLLFGIAAMTVMLYYSSNKMVVIADVAQGSTTSEETRSPNEQKKGNVKQLVLQQGEEKTNYLCIPLPVGTREEQIKIENHYMENQLCVFLEDASVSFFENQAVSGNLSQIVAGTVERSADGTRLLFELTDVYECRSLVEDGFLYVEFVSPREIYDKIVIIDAGHGGEDNGFEEGKCREKELALDIALKLKEKLDETDIKVYYTRMNDENPSEEARIHLANATRADMYIGIHANYDEEDAGIYGTKTSYNAHFFIPGFGSVELADLLEREVVTSISGKGLGLFEAKEECVELQNAAVPAAQLEVGYLSNRQEAILLQKDDYRQRIADGIYNAILKAYEMY